jgi:hypothetical protein
MKVKVEIKRCTEEIATIVVDLGECLHHYGLGDRDHEDEAYTLLHAMSVDYLTKQVEGRFDPPVTTTQINQIRQVDDDELADIALASVTPNWKAPDNTRVVYYREEIPLKSADVLDQDTSVADQIKKAKAKRKGKKGS